MKVPNMDEFQRIAIALAVVGATIAIVRLHYYLRDKAVETAQWKGEVNSDRESFKAFMSRIEGTIERIFERLPEKPYRESSPLRLNELGLRVLESTEGERWTKQLVPQLLDRVRDLPDYMVQNRAEEEIRTTIDKEPQLEAKIQMAAYEYGLPIEQVEMVLCIHLRDTLLATRSSA